MNLLKEAGQSFLLRNQKLRISSRVPDP
jgi:hypothetical protein